MKDTNSSADSLYQLLRDINNHLYANEGLSSGESLGELLKVLFIKIDGDYRQLSNVSISPEEFLEGMQTSQSTSFRRRIEEVFEKAKTQNPDLFDSSEKIKLSTPSLAFTVDKLQHINLAATDKDVKGLAFQRFMSSSQRGERGQYFTPDPVIQLCVAITKPRSTDRIIDPACGTGGFLMAAHKYFSNHDSGDYGGGDNGAKNLFGVEISPTVARIARMRLLMECGPGSNIIRTNSLSPLSEIEGRSGTGSLRGSFDVVLTNPPFGTQGKVLANETLVEYQLGRKWKSVGETWKKTEKLQVGQVPELLFIERCLELLRPGGRLAIVLPNGDFENVSLGYVRQYIREQAHLLGVVSLPQETFIPFGTGVKTSVMFLQKKNDANESDAASKHIFMARIRSVGYEGNKTAATKIKKDGLGADLLDEDGNPVIDEDVSLVLSDYNKFISGDYKDLASAFAIPSSEIVDRFDVEYYDPAYKDLDFRLGKHAAKLSDLVDFAGKKSPKLKEKNGTIRYIELSDVDASASQIVTANEMRVHEAPSRATYEVLMGDIITAVAGNSLGTNAHVSAIVPERFSGCICSNGFRVLRPRGVSAYYLLAFMRSQLFLRQVFRGRTGAAIPSISDRDLLGVVVPRMSSAREAEIAAAVCKSYSLREEAEKLLEYPEFT